MNKGIKRKADELVEQFVQELIDNSNWDAITSDGVKCAILSTKNTIDALNAVVKHDKERYGITSRGATIELDEQTEILKELESRI